VARRLALFPVLGLGARRGTLLVQQPLDQALQPGDSLLEALGIGFGHAQK
jgi:hypothetical protein